MIGKVNVIRRLPFQRNQVNLRRNKCEAARVLLSLKTRMLKELGWKP